MIRVYSHVPHVLCATSPSDSPAWSPLTHWPPALIVLFLPVQYAFFVFILVPFELGSSFWLERSSSTSWHDSLCGHMKRYHWVFILLYVIVEQVEPMVIILLTYSFTGLLSVFFPDTCAPREERFLPDSFTHCIPGVGPVAGMNKYRLKKWNSLGSTGCHLCDLGKPPCF